MTATRAISERTLFGDLQPQLRGTLLLESVPGYDEARSVWNGAIDRRPAAVVRCLGTADVVVCVNFAREREIMLSIKGGGHNIAGLAVYDGALMLDMSLMRGVVVDRRARVARAQPGCLLGDLDRETQLHGLATVLGFVSNTGIAGLSLGGGFGYLTRRFGWTCDNVRSFQLVTAEGPIVCANDNENQDLFWALRGGGGNFGVVTGFEYQVHEVGPIVTAGAIAWPGEASHEVLEMFSRVIEDAPAELTCAAVLRIAPPAPWLPQELHHKPVVMLLICQSAESRQVERTVASIKSFGRPAADIVERRPYCSQQSLVDATQPKGRRNYWKAEYLASVPADLITRMIAHFESMVSPHSSITLFPIDGAIAELPHDYSAVGNRDARVVLNILGSWEQPEDDERNIAWTLTAWRETRSFSTGGTSVNFLTEDEGQQRIRAAYGPNYERLVSVKEKWDPRNLFRVNKNIASRA